VRLLPENVGVGLLRSKTHSRQRGSDHYDEQDFDRGKRERRETVAVFEGEPDKEGEGLHNVTGEKVEDELRDAVEWVQGVSMLPGRAQEAGGKRGKKAEESDVLGEHATTFFDSCENGSKVVVGENDVGSVLGDVRSSAHSDTDVGTLERGRVVDTVSSCRREGASQWMMSEEGKRRMVTHSWQRKPCDDEALRPCGPWCEERNEQRREGE
jgi:hypothetical protein